ELTTERIEVQYNETATIEIEIKNEGYSTGIVENITATQSGNYKHLNLSHEDYVAVGMESNETLKINATPAYENVKSDEYQVEIELEGSEEFQYNEETTVEITEPDVEETKARKYIEIHKEEKETRYTIRTTNKEDKKARINITEEIPSVIAETKEDVDFNPEPDEIIEGSLIAKWSLMLEPGETKDLTYTVTGDTRQQEFTQPEIQIQIEELITEIELTINIEGNGTTDPEEGTHTYEEGEEVTMEATPEEGYFFKNWTGDHIGEEEETTITMDKDKEIIANFQNIEAEKAGLLLTTIPIVTIIIMIIAALVILGITLKKGMIGTPPSTPKTPRGKAPKEKEKKIEEKVRKKSALMKKLEENKEKTKTLIAYKIGDKEKEETKEETGENICPVCGKEFETEKGMKIHRTQIHGKEESEEETEKTEEKVVSSYQIEDEEEKETEEETQEKEKTEEEEQEKKITETKEKSEETEGEKVKAEDKLKFIIKKLKEKGLPERKIKKEVKEQAKKAGLKEKKIDEILGKI
ncbi:MAG: InlB B-repeat-containing protein, partial [archaeon]